MPPRVFVIVLNFNGTRWLTACLDALLQTAYSDFSIIVVDNASTDDSPKMIRERCPEIILLQNDRNDGFSAGNNVGIRYALERQADYVALLNPDTRVKPDWLSRLIEIGEREPQLGILGAVQLHYDNEEWNSWTRIALTQEQQALLLDKKNCPAWLEMEWVEGSCFAIKREVLQAVGLFDPIFFSFYEEIDYCRRARYHGFRTGLVTQCKFHHYRGGLWEATSDSQTGRNYQCDKSQFIYSLTAPDRAMVSNLVSYGQTFLVKCKEALVTMKYSRLLELARMQLSIWRQSLIIWRKWRADRLKLTGYESI
jgi:GT2 family glycosyltransferase